MQAGTVQKMTTADGKSPDHLISTMYYLIISLSFIYYFLQPGVNNSSLLKFVFFMLNILQLRLMVWVTEGDLT